MNREFSNRARYWKSVVGAASNFAIIWLSWLTLMCGAVAAQEKAAEKKSPPEALNSFADAASFQNNGAFDLAVEEWEKFLKQFPDDPLTTKARHYAGVCHLQLKHFAPAADHFQTLLAKDPKFELAEEASINLGWCQFSLGGQGKKELYDQAIKTLTAHLEKFPKGKFGDQANFYVGESHYAQGRKPEAIKAYQRLIAEHEKSTLRADALYALGVTHEELKQFAEASKVYDSFIKEFATSDLVTEVTMRKGETLFQTGAIAEAEKIFGAVAGNDRFAAADHAMFRQADCAAKQENFPRAAELYAKVASREPNSAYRADAAIAAGRCFYRADKLDDAATWFQKTVELKNKDLAEAAHWLCRIHLKKNEPQKVVELVDLRLPQAGDSSFAVNLKMDQADALFELADWKAESIDRYLNIVADHPRHELAPQAQYNAAFTALELKRFDDAAKHAATFREKFASDRLAPDAWYVAGEAQLLLRKYSEAAAAYRELIGKHGMHADANAWRVRLGLTQFLDKKHADAVKSLAGFLPQLKAPDQIAEAQYLIGASQFELNQSAEAAQALAASLAANPKWRQADEAMLLLSRTQRAQNKLDDARATVKKLLAEFSDSKVLDQTHYRAGEYHDAASDFPAAIAEFEIVLSKFAESPFAPYAAYGKGWALLKAKEFKAGAESFSMLLSQHPKHELAGDAHFARAMCRRQSGQPREALADLAEFLKTNPPAARKSDALYERGLAEGALKQFAEAAKTFAALLDENKSYPRAANVLYELAWARKNGDQPAEAAAAFARLVAEHADSPLAAEASFHVGEEHYNQKRFDEAIKAYASAKPKAVGDIAENVRHKLGWSHFRLGQYDQASAQFNEQLQQFKTGPLAPDALFMKAECLFKQQKFKEAWPAFQAAAQTLASAPQMQALTYLHGGQSAAQLELWAEAMKQYDEVANKHAGSAYLAEALYERGWAKQNLKQVEAATADYEQAATISRGEVGARARFMFGELQFERKEHEAAIKSFLRVMYGYGGENAPEAVKNWQASAGFEAGRCAEVQIKDAPEPQLRAKLIQDAKTYYTFVAEKHAQHKFAAQAKERLAALAKQK